MDNFRIVESRLFQSTKRLAVKKSLDASMLRSKAISHNLANVDIQGYQRKEIVFEEKLHDALQRRSKGKRTDDHHIEISKKATLRKLKPEIDQPYDRTMNSGINNVDVDIENSKMAENQILYNYGVKFASYEGIKSAIRGKM